MENKIRILNKTSLFLIITVVLTFIFYFHTLFYSVKAFDELTIFKEAYLPIVLSVSEIYELISNLGLHQHVESNNILYSSIFSLRCNPFGNCLQLLVQFFFQKNPFYYHLYGLILHIINTILVFLILSKISIHFLSDTESKLKLFFISIFTIFWSTHPVNIESVLLATNANITLSYGLSLLTFYLYLKFSSNQKPIKLFSFQALYLFISFMFALLIAEFHFMLPLILFAYTIGINSTKKLHIKNILLSIFPVLLATVIYIVLFLLSNTKTNFQTGSSLNLIFERIFWLSPQTLFHFIKLLLLPVKLSVDQTLLVKIADSLFAPYAIFCIGFIFLLLIISIFSLYKAKKQTPFLFIILFPFLLSLLPYSQILAPVYNLASERYLYFPSFMLIFGVAHFVFFIISKYSDKKKFIYLIATLFISVLLTSSIRAYIRTLDWKDNITLYSSAINATDNPLFKAYRYKSLTEKIFLQYPEREVDLKFQKLAIKNLKKAISIYKKKAETVQVTIPEIVNVYGLDPKTFLAKSVFILAQCDFNLNNDYRRAQKIMEKYMNDLSVLDSSALAFYASLLYHNGMQDRALYILNEGYKLRPYSTRIILSLCELTYLKYGDLKAVEDYCLKAFKYFPYDSYTIYALANIYRLMNDHEKYAYFSYIYGLRNHSIEALKTAYNEYLFLNSKVKAEAVMNKMIFIEKESQKRK